MSPRIELLARCLGLSVLCLGLSLGCGDGGVPPQPPPVKGVVDAAASKVAVDRSTGVLPDGHDVAVVTVTVLGKDGSPLAGRPVTVAVEGEGASVAVAAQATAANGEAQARVASTVAGVKTVRASVKDVDGAQVSLTATATVEFVAAPSIRKLVFREALPDGVAGVPLSGLEVAIQDASGAVVPDNATEVTLALGSGGIVLPEGLLKVTTVAGVARFPNVVLERAGANYHFMASAPGFEPAASTFFTVAPGAPVTVGLSTPLETAVAGVAQDLQVTVQDAYSNTVTHYTGTVKLTSTDLAATMPAAHAFTAADAGQYTFTGITFRTAGTHELQIKDGTSAISNAFNVKVSAGPLAKLLMSDFKVPVNAGASLDLTVALTDAFGNARQDFTGTVHFTSSDALAVLPPDAVFTPADQGQKRLTGLVFKTAGTQTLTGVDTANAALTTTVDADVRSLAAASFEVIAGAGPFVAGNALSYELVARDVYGNVAKGYTSTVVFTSTDAQAVLPGAFTFTLADEGRHTFSVELRTVGDQEVVATDVAAGALQGTHTYSIVPAVLDRVAFVSAPVTGNVREALADVQVALRDAYGNTIHDASRDVKLELAGGSFSQGPVTQTTADGATTFTGLVVEAEGTYQLKASVDGLLIATSADLVITDAVAPAVAQDFEATALSDSSIRLDWTAPGDDGDLGTAAAYELRYSTADITEANFDTATLATGVGAPQSPGTAETFTVTGLEVGTTYFFALKTFDGANNGSALATVSATTTDPCADYVCTPPASTCAADGRSLVTYSQACVVVAGAPSCEAGPSSTDLCPGAEGVCFEGACTTATGPAAGELFLSEVMHSPSAGTTEYLELTNTSGKLLNVAGLSVSYSDGVTAPSSITVDPGTGSALLVASGEALVLAQDAASQTNGGVSARYAYGSGFVLGNTGTLTVKQGATNVDSLTYTGAFPQTTGRAMSLASSIVGTAGSARSWYWCDSAGSLSGGDRGTPGQPNDDCGMNVNPPVDFCNIQYPKTFPSGDGVYPATISAIDSFDIFSQFYDADITTRNLNGNDFHPRIEAQLGYGADATNPEGWTWTQAGFNAGYSAPGGSNDDEMKASLRIPTPGTFSYGFRYRFTDAGAPWVYCDQNGAAVPPAGTYGSVTVHAPLTNHVVISEFCGGNGSGTAATDEFIELYNPTNSNVDLSNWQVSYKSATGTTWSSTVTIPAGKVIRAHGYFLLAGANYSGGATAPADVPYTFDTSASTTTGGHVRIQRLVSGTYVDVDKLGWGTGNSPEGTAGPAHPAVGGSLERKAVSTSTSATMAVGGTDAARGNAQDTDNNSVDFVTRAARQPQSSSSPLEFY
ncbi:lamin tail domain-containing protein [Corallococcus llansteffanensis]|uniref:Lamin tail domain-containing protein n=1 Tax=Corallococcus llansteffanensis TaxID=2316731 RepID=A0A3A8PXN3_9BACT|nr:lamin tail domain-containing protein [Corallococcus llansteffanensis]RKH61179.1 hypothetical protein D7V93_12155 [Corallococcus llansteffanensis]